MGCEVCTMDADGCTRHGPKGCARPCCVVQRKPDSDEEDETPAPPAKQQRTTTPAPAASSALATAPPHTGDTSRSEVLLGDRIMVGQTVKLNFPKSHRGYRHNGTSVRTVACEAASEERPYYRFEVKFDDGVTHNKKFKPENLLPAAPRPIPQRPAELSNPAIDFSASNNRSSSTGDKEEKRFALAVNWLPETDDLRDFVAMEKYDGVRAMWEPSGWLPCATQRGGFRTRGGAPDKPLQSFPPSIVKLLPTDMRLDGEIWSRRGDFESSTCFRSAPLSAT